MPASTLSAQEQRVSAAELRSLELFAEDSPEAIDWIAGRMFEVSFASGDIIIASGQPAEHFLVVLEGEAQFTRDSNPYASAFVRKRGQAAGVLPFSRMKVARGTGHALVPTRLGVMHVSHLRELVYRAPCLGGKLIAEMTDRTREITRMDERADKLLALGKLSAGLAHELNNPAAAATRSAARLREVLFTRRRDALELRTAVIPRAAADLMAELGDSLEGCAATPGLGNPLERADREDELGDWLSAQGVESQLAGDLTDAGIDAARLQPLAGAVPPRLLELGLRILAADFQILCLTREVEEASRRISELVQAVKSYSYMDQAHSNEIDVEAGLDVTLRMFQYQLKRGVQVQREFAGNLPKVRGNGSELNQVWTNLIDNALDAMCPLPVAQQVLRIRTCREPLAILVEIGDSGPGIPAEIQGRIFEPFFTTKGVGEGTGLGLDIVRRILRNHKASLSLQSKPGSTVFQIRLPLAP